MWLLWIGLRLVYFVGDYMEDAPGFVAQATAVADGVWSPRPDLQGLRIGTYLPAGAAVWLLGRTEVALALWPLASSAVGLSALFGIGRLLGMGRWRFLAGALWAIYPADVIFSTVLMPDAIQTGWMLASVYVLLGAIDTGSLKRFLASGLLTGLAYLTRENFLLMVPALSSGILILPARQETRRARMTALSCYLGGLAVVVGAEAAMYTFAIGDPLHRPRVSQAYYGVADAVSRHGLNVDLTTIPLTLFAPLEWMRGSLAAGSLNPGQAYHAHVFVLAAIAVATALTGGVGDPVARRRLAFLLLWCLVPLAWHQFGSQSLVTWVPMHRLPRQLLLYGPAAVVLAAWSAGWLWQRTAPAGRQAGLLIGLLLLGAWHLDGVRRGLTLQSQLIRQTTEIHDRLVHLLAGYRGRIFVDSAEMASLHYFLNTSGDQRVDLRDLFGVSSCGELADGLVITGSNAGWQMAPPPPLVANAWATLPCLRQIPSHWRPIVDAPWLPERVYRIPALPEPRVIR